MNLTLRKLAAAGAAAVAAMALALRVVTAAGVDLGEVERMLETGANDVMVVRGELERLIPFISGTVVRSVDVERGAIVVDWHPDD